MNLSIRKMKNNQVPRLLNPLAMGYDKTQLIFAEITFPIQVLQLGFKKLL